MSGIKVRSLVVFNQSAFLGDPPRAPHFCYCCQRNWWVVVRRVQMGVSITDAVHSHSVDRWALSGAELPDLFFQKRPKIAKKLQKKAKHSSKNGQKKPFKSRRANGQFKSVRGNQPEIRPYFQNLAAKRSIRQPMEWSRCPGSMARRARDSVAPLRRSSAGWIPARIGRLSLWCRTQASSHNSQGVVDGGVNEAGVSTTAPDGNAVLCSRMDQG